MSDVSPLETAYVAASISGDAEFLAHLKELCTDWRYSDELIGIVCRRRYPADYSMPSASGVMLPTSPHPAR